MITGYDLDSGKFLTDQPATRHMIPTTVIQLYGISNLWKLFQAWNEQDEPEISLDQRTLEAVPFNIREAADAFVDYCTALALPIS